MNTNEFIENVSAQFDDLKVNLGLDTRFRELPTWSSITAVSILAMIDEEYDVQLKAEDIRSAETIGDILGMVVAKLGEV